MTDEFPPAEPVSLSVVVVTRNEADTIEKCLESVIETCERSVPTFEVILVDSRSTDETVELASSYPISIYRLQIDDVTPGAGRRAGTMVANSDRMLFVDGDMVLTTEWLPRALEYMNTHDVAGVDGELNESSADAVRSVDSIRGVALYDSTALESVGGFDPYLGSLEDVHLGYELTVAGYELVRLPVVAAYHPDRSSSLTEPFRRWGRGYTKGTGQVLRRSWPSPQLIQMHAQRIRYRLLILAWYLAGLVAIRHPVSLGIWFLGTIAGGLFAWRQRGFVGAISFFLHKHLSLLGMVGGFRTPLPPRESFGREDFERLTAGRILRGNVAAD